MAVTVLPADSLTESVKLAVRSPSTCSATTVSSLQALLRGASQPPDAKSTRKNTSSKETTSSRTKSARTKTTVKDASQSLAEQDAGGLSSQERLVLATEVFNTTLKALTDASKKGQASLDSTPSRESKSAGRTAGKASDTELGVHSAAECARLALATLRMLKTDRSQDNGLPNMQIEQGVCVLVGKLISLGLNDLAYKELKSLKRRIQQHLDLTAAGKKKADTKEAQDDEAGKERMSDLVTFSNLANAKSLYGLLVPFHANAMRLIAADRKASTIQKLCPSLQLSDPSSPAQVIMAAVKSGNLSDDKAALQLQLLSNTVLSFCPRTPQPSDSASPMKPLTTLTLQLLSLEIRCLSWKLSGHMCDETKEVLDPLARYIGGFSHRSKGIEKSEFAAIYKTITRLQSAVADYKKKTPDQPKNNTPSANIMVVLGQLALDAGCIEESLKLLNQAVIPLWQNQSLSLATVRCKIAIVHFKTSKNSKGCLDEFLKSISDATAALALQLKGSTNDLDELLIEAAKLKKVTLAWFGEAITKTLANDSKKNEVSNQIREYLQAFLRFLRRYVGRAPTEDNDKETDMFLDRIAMSKSIVIAAVDSAVAVGKLSIMSQSPPWEDILPILSDSHRLLTTIEAAVKEPEPIGASLTKLSNLFWSRYIKEKEAGQGYRELLSLLKQSTHLLSSCSPSHRNQGFAALKFERIAHLYLDGSMHNESEKAFRQSIKEYIDTGTLEQIAEDGAADLKTASQDPKSHGFMLGRVLSAFLKMKLRRKGSISFALYDDTELAQEQRGMILEWQMGLLVDMQSYSASDDGFRATLSPVVSNLLEIYSVDLYPIRRLRVTITALRFLLENPNALDSTLHERLLDEGTESLGFENGFAEDAHLAQFAPHTTNSLRVIIGLHQGKIDANELGDVLASWTSMARQCQDLDSLLLCVNDTEYWVLQLKALVDYTEIHGLWKAQLSALELILRAAEFQQSGDPDAIIILSRLVLQNCRLGYCQKAADLLSRGEQYLAQHKVSPLATISYKLAQAEYLLETGEVHKAVSTLSTARGLYEKSQNSRADLSVWTKISWERLVADAVFIQSRLSSAQGSMTQALYFAKLSVRLNCRIWAKVEKLAQRKQDKALPAAASSEVEAVADGIDKLDLSQNGSSPDLSSTSYIQGAPFWPHLGSHHICLLNLATLSAHHGLFQDAIYYGEQALKIDKTFDANIRLMAAQTQLGSHWILGGNATEGQALLAAAAESTKQTQTSIEFVSLQMALASLYKEQGHHEMALRVLLDADKIITSIMSSDVPGASDEIAVLEEKMDNLRVRGSSRRAQAAAPATPTARRTRATTATTKRGAPAKKDLSGAQSRSLLQLKGNVLRQQADCLRALRDFERSARTLDEARQFAVARESRVSLEIGESEHLLADAIRHFASHAVYCVLPESTISLPSLKSPSKAAAETTVKASAAKRTKAPARGTRRTQKATEDFSIMLSKAGDCLNSVFADASVLGSTLDGHAASRLMSRISMLSHATTPGGPAVWALSPANMNEIGRVGAFARERIAIDIDRQLADSADPLLWPTSSDSTAELDDEICSNFSQNYVDILPENWNVLSLSLSADQTEFVISRLQKNSAPFLLRLPLRRGNSDEDEEQFTFEDGKEEMQEIIKLANESAHAAKAQTDRLSKKEWWKNRESLDGRLESLLQNIESLWFGGFRGVFSPLSRETTALARFSSSFQDILDKHLPSRQKGGKNAGPQLTLHQNVVELFIGLRDLEAQEEPEDTLMDLLYFVVDILQFQGERNAYDEIDFDRMVVDTLDALRSYHEAARDELAARSANHTVLVLDKALHLFPWESLPCLQGFPVCRVPSLECLRERVLQFGSSRSTAVADRTSGSFILNPTGDLRTTQNTFEKDLLRLESWTGIIHREPTEDEFRSSIESKDLFLYFGHGSGAQYIRGRTIKRLSQCAVAFLMGCSSGTLTEAGEYEPYGTPMHYLHAGSPALVATLWDVTDKDIDRFAASAFEQWGLMGEVKGSGVALDEAVARSRGKCVLKYLNGAAPVVYGVPVMLQ
ncbi:uncharacterized protein PFLUO_LOCUS6490 [Penicillium psychrofluorescens]|uniref:uncharacterized protein n=1 Tax=Penicillium psychrofluorescens TaxID=3158075 RepID=UPI003CCE0DB3